MTTHGSAPPEQPPPPRPARAGLDHFARAVMSGEARGARASLLRAALTVAEPFYAGAAAARNWLIDSGLKRPHRLSRPVISVGNITTGGTGKTPLVRWLAGRLREEGRRAAVIARGYGAAAGTLGDEQLMLDRLLNAGRADDRVTVIANPDRVAAAERLLRERPDLDAIVLDDGFQHRRLARDLDVVLLSATSPFGYDHVLPRGMLREPLSGLRRANAVVITRTDQVSPQEVEAIERRVRSLHPDVPVYRAIHAPGALHTADARTLPLGELSTRAWFALCGIGDPQAFVRQLAALGGRCAGNRWFPDHHHYSERDVDDVRRAALAAGADVIVTTEKDWAKLQSLRSARDGHPPLWRVDVRVQFLGDGEALLWDQVKAALSARGGG
jgi:tetraacyldisaccharide 4'-kinase